MMHRRDRSKQGNGATPVAAMLWLTILVALWSALVPLGPPASRAIGSAFSPATTTVALKARASQPVEVKIKVLTPDLGGSAGDAVAIAAFYLFIARVALSAHALWPMVPASIRPFDPASFRHARAPPALPHH
ncbi:hypothetical protein [Sphingobium aromaticiconvertens]|uniref:hypothetical protein n=1 Tax=Sphingobium aromaticiconvertens TaxID=365341 RepID=UPI0030160157